MPTYRKTPREDDPLALEKSPTNPLILRRAMGHPHAIHENGWSMPPDLARRIGSPSAGWLWNRAAMYCVAMKFTTTSRRHPSVVARQL
jgi:hypothetical protein